MIARVAVILVDSVPRKAKLIPIIVLMYFIQHKNNLNVSTNFTLKDTFENCNYIVNTTHLKPNYIIMITIITFSFKLLV